MPKTPLTILLKATSKLYLNAFPNRLLFEIFIPLPRCASSNIGHADDSGGSLKEVGETNVEKIEN